MYNSPEDNYTIIPCGERIFYLYHRLGIQSNVIVTATYDNPHELLNEDLVLNALRQVVEAHPMMRMVGVVRPSPKSKDRHTLQIAMLHEINLRKCVEFVDDPKEVGITPALLERAHNEWEHTSDIPHRPLFKLIVVGNRDVMLVYHHMMADGISGYVFHREFLAALNTTSTPPACNNSTSYIVRSDPNLAQVPRDWSLIPNEEASRDKRWHPSLLRIILNQSSFFFAQVFCSSGFIFSKLSSSKPHLNSVTEVADTANRTVTAVVSGHITARQISTILDACRKQGTTFTPLLMTMLMLVMSTDYNSEARIGSTRFALDMRPHLPVAPEELGGGTRHGTIFNCTSGMARASRIRKYRSIAKDLNKVDTRSEKRAYDVDEERLWELTRKYKQWMTEQTEPAVRAVRASINMNSDLEHVLNRIMPFAGTVLSSTTLVSNLGMFRPGAALSPSNTSSSGPGWTVSEVQFSAAATNGLQGSQGPIFNVSGLKGGDTIINAVFEESIISREEVQEILDTTIAKLVALVP
ncbi:unnamed protein product [Clonostachys rosea]|uniref:Condensation domain-containing protein n=1 Tax=Bionectria ochroleuca TaxID=29856 RepID=A0ABY6UBQ2_BIOOC|nr:unnamed protein product [Clonostachys rosea]